MQIAPPGGNTETGPVTINALAGICVVGVSANLIAISIGRCKPAVRIDIIADFCNFLVGTGASGTVDLVSGYCFRFVEIKKYTCVIYALFCDHNVRQWFCVSKYHRPGAGRLGL